jgi:hypothetical protein
VAFFFPGVAQKQVSDWLKSTQYKISNIKLSISMIAVTPATESTNASLASW